MDADRIAKAEDLRRQILDLTEEYAALAHAPQPFRPGESATPVSGRVYGASEMRNLVESALEFWLTTGRFNAAFEKRLAAIIDVKHALTCNSGSSANLLAFTSLTSPMLRGMRRIIPGDEVITVAAGFPTTVNPIIQNGAIPVFVDVDIPTYNAIPERIAEAITERTRAIMLAHTLGNPFDLGTIAAIAKEHGLWLIEDCCDALGARFNGQHVGTFGAVGTLSFFPAHHITMGEGGAVFTNRAVLRRALESLRDWGRDCWCAPGRDNTCGRRFAWQLGDLPDGYDHKYTYSNLGYNLKITDMQAAVGLAQLDRLRDFVTVRKRNFQLLYDGLSALAPYLILPEATPNSDPSWFGFLITLRDDSPFTRDDLVSYLNQRKIATRYLFAGNLIKQPYMEGRRFRVHGPLDNTEIIMNRTFWIGVYPGLSEAHIAHVLDSFHDFATVRGLAA